MRKTSKRNVAAIICPLIISIVAGWSEPVQSQDKYPERAIEFVVPYSAGGGVDTAMRVVAPYVNNKYGVPANVVNKAGGNTVPACLEVFMSRPDGYTLITHGT